MKIQNSVVFVQKILKINILKTKNTTKLGTVVIIQLNIEILHIGYVI